MSISPEMNGFVEQFDRLVANVSRVMRGKDGVVRAALSCVVAEGHLLVDQAVQLESELDDGTLKRVLMLRVARHPGSPRVPHPRGTFPGSNRVEIGHQKPSSRFRSDGTDPGRFLPLAPAPRLARGGDRDSRTPAIGEYVLKALLSLLYAGLAGSGAEDPSPRDVIG